jgi:hypothetical protein
MGVWTERERRLLEEVHDAILATLSALCADHRHCETRRCWKRTQIARSADPEAEHVLWSLLELDHRP